MRRAKNPRRTQIHVSSSLTRDTYAGVAEWHTYLSQQQVFEGSKSPFHSGRRRADVHPDVVRPSSRTEKISPDAKLENEHD